MREKSTGPSKDIHTLVPHTNTNKERAKKSTNDRNNMAQNTALKRNENNMLKSAKTI